MRTSRLIRPGIAACAALLALSAIAHERDDIHQQAEQVQPLLPGMQAPAFERRSADGTAVRFVPGEHARPVVLTFYRGGWCPFCNLHLSELRHAEAELEQLGFDNWFVSMDRQEVLKPSLDEDLGYTLLSDADGSLTRAFGIAFRLDDETHDRYLGYGLNVEEVSGHDHHILPAPSTFIIGTDGLIHFQYTNPDYRVRLDPDVLLAAARAYLDGSDGRLRQAREAQRAEQQE